MIDQRFDRDYQAGRAAFNDSIDHLFGAVMASFQALSEIQFDAPWQRQARKPGRPAGLA